MAYHPCPRCGEQTGGAYSAGGLLWTICDSCMARNRQQQSDDREQQQQRDDRERARDHDNLRKRFTTLPYTGEILPIGAGESCIKGRGFVHCPYCGQCQANVADLTALTVCEGCEGEFRR